jgi:hypothetical protein
MPFGHGGCSASCFRNMPFAVVLQPDATSGLASPGGPPGGRAAAGRSGSSTGRS